MCISVFALGSLLSLGFRGERGRVVVKIIWALYGGVVGLVGFVVVRLGGVLVAGEAMWRGGEREIGRGKRRRGVKRSASR